MTKSTSTNAKSDTPKAKPSLPKKVKPLAKKVKPSLAKKAKPAISKSKMSIKSKDNSDLKSPSLGKKSKLDLLLSSKLPLQKIRYYTAELPTSSPDTSVLKDLMEHCASLRILPFGRKVLFGLADCNDEEVIQKLLSKTYQGEWIKISTVPKYTPLLRKIIAPINFGISTEDMKSHFDVDNCYYYIRGKRCHFVMEFQNIKAIEAALIKPFEKFGKDLYLHPHKQPSLCEVRNNPAKQI